MIKHKEWSNINNVYNVAKNDKTALVYSTTRWRYFVTYVDDTQVVQFVYLK